MYRISVTTLECFRRYLTEASPFDDEVRLLETLRGVFVGNPKTQFGAAYHKILEGKYTRGRGGNVYANGYLFTEDQAAPALEFRSLHPDVTTEVAVAKTYDTHFFPIQVSGRVDALEGLFIRDGKTKFRPVAWEEYMASCQWKFYCDMLGADSFFYDVFEVKHFPDDVDLQTKFFPDVQVRPVQSICCTTYGGMDEELSTLLNDFLGYIANRKLWKFLKPALNNESILD